LSEYLFNRSVNTAVKSQFIVVYEKLFNLIFESGIVPESWLIRNLIPIYKNKGDSNDPKIFLPITIVSCLGKLFTAVLTAWFNVFVHILYNLKHFSIGIVQ
jgi:hypothetical protein